MRHTTRIATKENPNMRLFLFGLSDPLLPPPPKLLLLFPFPLLKLVEEEKTWVRVVVVPPRVMVKVAVVEDMVR